MYRKMHYKPPTGCPFLGGCSVAVDVLFIVTPIVGVCNCSMFCCTLLYVHSSFAIILMGQSLQIHITILVSELNI